MVTIGEYVGYRKSLNPHLETSDIDNEMHARALRKQGKKEQLQKEKSLRRYRNKALAKAKK